MREKTKLKWYYPRVNNTGLHPKAWDDRESRLVVVSIGDEHGPREQRYTSSEVGVMQKENHSMENAELLGSCRLAI